MCFFGPNAGKDFAGNRNRIENNRIIDSGSTNGVAIDVQGATETVVLSGNEIIGTRHASVEQHFHAAGSRVLL